MSKKSKGGNVLSVVSRIAEPVAKQLGLSLWDIRFVKEGADWFLRIFIDKPGGVTIDDCEAFSRLAEPLIDEADPIIEAYYLEVSSPGIERELVKEAHFAAFTGSAVKVRTIRPVKGQREFIGTLKGLIDGQICIEIGNEEVLFNKKETDSVRLYEDFGGLQKNE